MDTLGAGDAFVAGAIYSLINDSSLSEDVLNFACKLAQGSSAVCLGMMASLKRFKIA